MAKTIGDPAKRTLIPKGTATIPARGVGDEAHAFRDDARERYAPADNLWDAIRFDVAPLGGIEIQPLIRLVDEEPPFSDIDEDWFDDESYKDE